VRGSEKRERHARRTHRIRSVAPAAINISVITTWHLQ
jgi:hypothetical protein